MESASALRCPRLLPSKFKVRNDEKTLEESNESQINHEKLKKAALLILEAIGEDAGREGLRETPDRFARMLSELCCGVGVDASSEVTCKFDEGTDGLVVVSDINFSSICEHHLVPFIGHAHVAYLPSDGVVTGLSKLARIVEATSRRPQVQERMTVEIAAALEKAINPRGIAVIVEAEHFCMSMRGIKKPGAKTRTSAFRGVLQADKDARAEAVSMMRS